VSKIIVLKEWQRPHKCEKCGAILYSKHSGEFVSCPTFKNEENNKCSYVDQTPWYGRYGGYSIRALTDDELTDLGFSIE
jgi:hypothetical protein